MRVCTIASNGIVLMLLMLFVVVTTFENSNGVLGIHQDQESLQLEEDEQHSPQQSKDVALKSMRGSSSYETEYTVQDDRGSQEEQGNSQDRRNLKAAKLPSLTKSTKAPKTTSGPKSTKAPKTTSGPKSTKAPKTTSGPKSTKAPKATKSPKSTKTPKRA